VRRSIVVAYRGGPIDARYLGGREEVGDGAEIVVDAIVIAVFVVIVVVAVGGSGVAEIGVDFVLETKDCRVGAGVVEYVYVIESYL